MHGRPASAVRLAVTICIIVQVCGGISGRCAAAEQVVGPKLDGDGVERADAMGPAGQADGRVPVHLVVADWQSVPSMAIVGLTISNGTSGVRVAVAASFVAWCSADDASDDAQVAAVLAATASTAEAERDLPGGVDDRATGPAAPCGLGVWDERRRLPVDAHADGGDVPPHALQVAADGSVPRLASTYRSAFTFVPRMASDPTKSLVGDGSTVFALHHVGVDRLTELFQPTGAASTVLARRALRRALETQPTDEQRDLIAGLRREVRAAAADHVAEQVLPDDISAVTPADGGDTVATGQFWAAAQALMRAAVLLPSSDPRHFALWQITRTVYHPGIDPAEATLAFLKGLDGDRWERRYRRLAVDPQLVGSRADAWHALGAEAPPVAVPQRGAILPLHPLTRGTPMSVQRAALIAQFEGTTGLAIDDVGLVVDFGSGPGYFAALTMQNTGFSGVYILVDLPTQRALARFYLKLVGVHVVDSAEELIDVLRVRAATPQAQARSPGEGHGPPPTSGVALCVSSDELSRVLGLILPLVTGPSMFMSTWSLSEVTDLGVRDSLVQPIVRFGFDLFFLAYQTAFDGVSNLPWFDSFTHSVDEHDLAAERTTFVSWRRSIYHEDVRSRLLIGYRRRGI